VHCHLFVSLDAETSDCVLGFRLYGLLVSKILKHFGSFGESISTFSNAAVQDKFLDLDVSHFVGCSVALLL
jgi:hypothetical protein